MGLAEDRAALQAAADKLNEAAGVAIQLGGMIDEATASAASAIEGYDNQELVEATGMIAMASEAVADAGRQLAAAQNNLEAYIQKMS